MIEIGIEAAMTSVLRMLARKRKMMTIARTPPTRAEEPTLPMAFLIYSELFDTGRSWIWGMSRWISSISLSTPSATSTVFRPDCLKMAIRVPGEPLILTMRVMRR